MVFELLPISHLGEFLFWSNVVLPDFLRWTPNKYNQIKERHSNTSLLRESLLRCQMLCINVSIIPQVFHCDAWVVLMVQKITNPNFTELADSDIFASCKLVQASSKIRSDKCDSQQVLNCLLQATMINFIRHFNFKKLVLRQHVNHNIYFQQGLKSQDAKLI